MTPRVTLRQALDDPTLLGDVLGGDTWHTWRSVLLAAMGERLQPDEIAAFKQFTGRDTPAQNRVDGLWCCRDALHAGGGKTVSTTHRVAMTTLRML